MLGPVRSGPLGLLLSLSLAWGAAADGLVAPDFFAASYDPGARQGSILALSLDGAAYPIQLRSEEHVRELHELELGGRPALLAVWRDLASGNGASPELWVENEMGDLQRVWGGPEPLRWHHASFKLRSKQGRAELLVDRQLAAENSTQPRLGCRQLWRLGASGAELVKERLGAATTPAQRLNLLAHLAEGRQVGKLRELLGTLRQDGEQALMRAGVVMTRFGDRAGLRGQARELLGAMTELPGGAAMKAADRLLEMDWEDGEVLP